MGRAHVLITAATWAAAAPPVAAALDRPLQGPALLASTAVAATAALGPDWDHPDATLARCGGPLTRPAAHLVAALAGGHRRGTHTLLCAVLVTAAAALLGSLPTRIGDVTLPPNWAASAMVGFCAYTAVAASGVGRVFGRGGDALALTGAVVAVLATSHWLPTDWYWLPPALAVGWVMHCVQDSLTGGCPVFFYPLRVPFRLARWRTGGVTESALTTAAIGLLGYLALNPTSAPLS